MCDISFTTHLIFFFNFLGKIYTPTIYTWKCFPCKISKYQSLNNCWFHLFVFNLRNVSHHRWCVYSFYRLQNQEGQLLHTFDMSEFYYSNCVQKSLWGSQWICQIDVSPCLRVTAPPTQNYYVLCSISKLSTPFWKIIYASYSKLSKELKNGIKI